jgi:hypothetical protein
MHRLKPSSLLVCFFFLANNLQAQNTLSQGFQPLTDLFQEWRAFEKPPVNKGAPDYRAITFAKRRPAFSKLKDKLNALNYAEWPIEK